MGDSIESFQPDACPLLAIEDLSKGFTLHTADRRVRGCEHISLSVLPGEFVGVTGRSGSGKSTILKCIYRTNLPESGHIVYDSEAFGPVDLATLDERGAQFTLERLNGLAHRTLCIPQLVGRGLQAAAIDHHANNLIPRCHCASTSTQP